MSHELVGLVAICLGAYLGAFVQSFVVDLDCDRKGYSIVRRARGCHGDMSRVVVTSSA